MSNAALQLPPECQCFQASQQAASLIQALRLGHSKHQDLVAVLVNRYVISQAPDRSPASPQHP